MAQKKGGKLTAHPKIEPITGPDGKVNWQAMQAKYGGKFFERDGSQWYQPDTKEAPQPKLPWRPSEPKARYRSYWTGVSDDDGSGVGGSEWVPDSWATDERKGRGFRTEQQALDYMRGLQKEKQTKWQQENQIRYLPPDPMRVGPDAASQKKEAERAAKLKAEQARLAAERRAAADRKAAADRAAQAETLKAERAAKLKAEQGRLAAERAAKEQAARDAEARRVASVQAAQRAAEARRVAAVQAAQRAEEARKKGQRVGYAYASSEAARKGAPKKKGGGSSLIDEDWMPRLVRQRAGARIDRPVRAR